MRQEDVKKFLRYSDRELVEYALSRVNLEAKEERCIRACDMRGLTQEQAAEEMDRSVDGVQRWHRDGMRKLMEVWDSVPWIQKIADSETHGSKPPPKGLIFLPFYAETKRQQSGTYRCWKQPKRFTFVVRVMRTPDIIIRR